MFRSLGLLTGIALFSSAAAQNVWQVTVGDAVGNIIYTPTNVNASVGDTVQFTFNPKNHSVTQSTFASPCAPISGGFDSGFTPVAVGTTSNFPTFNITVNDTNPIWVYCRQGENTPASHCGCEGCRGSVVFIRWDTDTYGGNINTALLTFIDDFILLDFIDPLNFNFIDDITLLDFIRESQRGYVVDC
ncbi:hypothetical protein BJY52DRAFT_1185730 [Lactarius psammicola]|nr:hypothetical protein BJY52DRAFT_1185730 [Lactarius psammicola]